MVGRGGMQKEKPADWRLSCIAALGLCTVLILSGCGTDPESAAVKSDIRNGDLVSVKITASAWAPDRFGNPALDHNFDLQATCPTIPDSLDDRGDSGSVSLAEVIHGHADISFWFISRAACRNAGALISAARADLDRYPFGDSTKDFTRIRYQVRGGVVDSLRVPVDVTRDSTTQPKLSRFVSDMGKAVDP